MGGVSSSGRAATADRSRAAYRVGASAGSPATAPGSQSRQWHGGDRWPPAPLRRARLEVYRALAQHHSRSRRSHHSQRRTAGQPGEIRMSLVVMKFGGTSVEDATAIRRTASIVAGRVALGKQPVVVVSAMAKVTDQLLRAAATAVQGDRAGALLKNSAALVDEIDQKFDSLDEILRGLAAILELTPRVTDLIVSYGEVLSSRIVAAAFCEQGIDAEHVDAREVIITDSQYQKAIPQDALIEKRSQEKLLPLLAEDHVPVMGGFIASNEAGISTTLGRGGSDFTAALIGGALAAEAIEIWTDVDGIMSADPRVCPDALRVKVISFEEDRTS